MACNCGSKNRTTVNGVAAVSGTYRVMVNGRKVYETTNKAAAEAVASPERFENAVILAPGESA